MIRIVFLIRSLGAGGAEHQLCTLAKYLHEKGHFVRVVVFYENTTLESGLLDSGVTVIGLKRRGRWDLIPFFFRLLECIQKENPDVLYSYLPVANIWAVFVKIFLPHTRVVWGVRASDVDLKQYNWQTRLTDYIESLLSRIPDWIICNSHAGLFHAIKKGFPASRMSVISNGIDTNRFFPDRERGRRLRQRWNIQGDKKLIGMVARIDPMKDYPNFLQAAALLLQDKQDLHFLCVGDGPDELIKEYSQLASSLGLRDILTWAGYQQDMPAIYNALDILVSASAYGEGFSNVIGEAMACGTPCVATDVGDSALLVETFGELVPPSNPQALRDSILKLLRFVSESEVAIANQLAQEVTQQFSVDALASNTVLLFEKLVNSYDEIIARKS